MIPLATLRAIAAQIHRQPQFYGCLVAYEGDNYSFVVDPGVFMLPNYGRVMVILEEVPGGAIGGGAGPAGDPGHRSVERWDDATIQATAHFLSEAIADRTAPTRFRELREVLEHRGGMMPLDPTWPQSERYEALEDALRQATQSADGVREVNHALRDSGAAATPGWRTAANPEGPAFITITNRSRLASEIRSTGVNCGFTVVAALGVAGGGVAEVPTAGTSTALVIVAWFGFAASGIQCVNGMVRVSEAAFYNPDSNSLQDWDSNDYYAGAEAIVDAIGFATTLLSAPADIRDFFSFLFSRNALRVTEPQFFHLSRPQRLEELNVALRAVGRTPEGRAAIERATAAVTAGRTRRIIRPKHIVNFGRSESEAFGRTLLSLISSGYDVGTNDTRSWLYVHIVERNTN